MNKPAKRSTEGERLTAEWRTYFVTVNRALRMVDGVDEREKAGMMRGALRVIERATRERLRGEGGDG